MKPSFVAGFRTCRFWDKLTSKRFFSIYFCRCFMDGIVSSWHLRRTPSGNAINATNSPANSGLDPSLIQLFPTFGYSSVREFRREQYGFECAICLGEFKDDDILRLLTVCYHVFHEECIDLWLTSQKTCPVCRSDLDLPRETLEKNPLLNPNNDTNGTSQSIGSLEHAICINVREDDNEIESRGGNSEGTTRHHGEKQNQGHENIERFSRSHSTGHSIVVTREENDRYTLRLLEHVKVKFTRGHNTAQSCITFGEFSSPQTMALERK
ncbi:RING-H2 finger protein ATL3B precursor, putative [Ricinus communis]|uniref:RING-type E3 ubiquitin transferase n=1 Tax=Ricinus communis TaxID=3988 RepID=B9SNU6_RICCO|nr:RING-H2 finger protein ATL3B precursor, putative [Ricinus communis]